MRLQPSVALNALTNFYDHLDDGNDICAIIYCYYNHKTAILLKVEIAHKTCTQIERRR